MPYTRHDQQMKRDGHPNNILLNTVVIVSGVEPSSSLNVTLCAHTGLYTTKVNTITIYNYHRTHSRTINPFPLVRRFRPGAL